MEELVLQLLRMGSHLLIIVILPFQVIDHFLVLPVVEPVIRILAHIIVYLQQFYLLIGHGRGRCLGGCLIHFLLASGGKNKANQPEAG